MDVEKFLENGGVRITPVRILVTRVISAAAGPLSSLEIERELRTVDRSSISRTLALFAEKGLVHSVDDGSGSVKYELCHHCGEEHDDDLHPHFHCLRCGRTFCLENEAIPPVVLPEGFAAESVNYVVKGFCPDCRNF